MDTTTTSSLASDGDRAVRQRYQFIPHTDVALEGGFWASRLKTNRERTIPHIYQKLQETGSIDAFDPAWQWPEAATKRGPWGGTPTMFWDSDVGKWLEAASFSLATHPDPQLDAVLDGVIASIAQAQQPDGYLNTWFISVDPENRWKNLRDWHELYCAGHLIEAGVAHYQATGKRTLLDIVTRYSDLIAEKFGTQAEQQRGYCGHPEIELALVKLAHATGESRYLDLSRYFVDERGQQPHYFEQEAIARGEDPTLFWARSHEYNQSHRPVRDQHEAVGHAVRAAYLYSAMADLAGEDGDSALYAAADRLWTHLTTKRMYVTAGIGTSKSNEGFTGDYDLPNESAYAETCAAIAMIFWAQRMLQINCDRRFSDIMELALYNSVLSSITLDGEAFFYDNPLASSGGHHRQAWFGCPCCPPNLARLFASLGHYIYSVSDSEIAVHMYIQGNAHAEIGGQTITLQQETEYPWDGRVTLRVEAEAAATFGMRLRIPGWCTTAQLSVNGKALDPPIEQGYAVIEREWQSGDTIVLDLPMPVEALYAHPDVAADVGQMALRRGPLIYCLEQVDHSVPLHLIQVDDVTKLSPQTEPDLLGGITVLTGEAVAQDDRDWEGVLYRTTPPQTQSTTLRAIPYYAWDAREPGPMTVWIRTA